MLYDIMVYGSAVLRESSQPVASVDDNIRRLAKDMLETMYTRDGAGLAAQQIGRTESICVIDVRQEHENARPETEPGPEMPLVLINPVIDEADGEQVGPEGCLSFPEIFVDVSRADRVKVRYLGLDSREHVDVLTGLGARAVQHELDHLKGVLLVDHMSHVQKIALAGKLRRLKKRAVA